MHVAAGRLGTDTDWRSYAARRRVAGGGILRDGAGWDFDPRRAHSLRSLQAGGNDGPDHRRRSRARLRRPATG